VGVIDEQDGGFPPRPPISSTARSSKA
jgi:hypothetical protein